MKGNKELSDNYIEAENAIFERLLAYPDSTTKKDILALKAVKRLSEEQRKSLFDSLKSRHFIGVSGDKWGLWPKGRKHLDSLKQQKKSKSWINKISLFISFFAILVSVVGVFISQL